MPGTPLMEEVEIRDAKRTRAKLTLSAMHSLSSIYVVGIIVPQEIWPRTKNRVRSYSYVCVKMTENTSGGIVTHTQRSHRFRGGAAMRERTTRCYDGHAT